MLITIHSKTKTRSYVTKFTNLTSVFQELEELHKEGYDFMHETGTN